jgi:hypothetical protein
MRGLRLPTDDEKFDAMPDEEVYELFKFAVGRHRVLADVGQFPKAAGHFAGRGLREAASPWVIR